MAIFLENNVNGASGLTFEISADTDDGVFLSIMVSDDDGTLVDGLITTPEEADDLLAEVDAAVKRFHLLRASE